MAAAQMQPRGEFFAVDKATLAAAYDAPSPTIPGHPPLTGLPVLPGWTLKVNSLVEWRPTAPHPAYDFVQRTFMAQVASDADLAASLAALPASVTRVSVPVLYVDDKDGFVLKDVATEERLVRDGVPDEGLIAWLPQLWFLHRPTASVLFEQGKYQETMDWAFEGASFLHKNLYLRAREKLETAAALKAFETLFKHYSRNEELWRLEQWMGSMLPFDLEEHPELEQYRSLLAVQVGHLRPSPNEPISGVGIARWYRDESPPAGFDAEYVKNAMSGLARAPARLHWLIDNCRREGLKRIAEYGSIDGASLFYLTWLEDGMTITGYETSPECVARGLKLAQQCSAKIDLRLMHRFTFDGPFDAVALFEFLEHNDPEGGAGHLQHCYANLRPGGVLYITTPCGNWSAFNEETRELTLRKDHILAWTPARMHRFLVNVLGGRGLIEQCERVENPAAQEANAWVFASVRRPL